MPTYEYKCSAGHQYEMQQPFGSPAEQPCQKCGKPALRVLFAPPLVFKGGGFYKTANRGDQRIASQQASGDAEPETKSFNAGIDDSVKPGNAETAAKRKGKVEKAEPPAKIKDE
ncbi:MAG: zinc ribbon domain-containing protein [Dehalococcoidia bacterium]|nr:MAG: zinc ribbon domain-containing protein [Dehalococcoidia bacterium]